MTAIVSTYVPGQGFAVGADSLRIDAKTGVVVTENARKIFLIEGHGLRLVYAWAGASSLFLGDGQEFSFVDESANIGNAIATDKPESMGQYVGQFAARIHTRLRTICLPYGRLSDNPETLPRERIASDLLVGYYNGEPYRAEVSFSHRNLLLQEPTTDALCEAPDNFAIFSGSDVILQQFQPMEAPESLEEAGELIRRYIQVCIDNRNKYADCATFGGRVQVATVTKDKFEWIVSIT
jgi:hypothetical protein